jgi:hypothetical protein
MFTIAMASIHLVNMSMETNKNPNPSGALGKIPTMSIPHIAKGKKISIDRRGFSCFVVLF